MAAQSALAPATPSLLRRALRLDAFIVAASALLCVVAAGPLAELTGLPESGLMIVGSVFLPYAAWLWLATRHDPIDRGVALTVIGANLAWVVASAVLLMGSWLALTTTGFWTVAVVADVVACLALTQFYAFRRG